MTTDTTPMTPRALRVNLPRDEVHGLLEDIDAWQQATQARLTFSGVLRGPYASLYFSLADGSIPQALIALCVRAVRVVRGSAAVCGAWMIRMEPGRVLTEDQIREADARLIAAAPDLLAACEAIIEEQSIGMYGAISNEGIAQLRAAVAKATDSEAAQ